MYRAGINTVVSVFLKPLLSISTKECLITGTCSLVAKDTLHETC